MQAARPIRLIPRRELQARMGLRSPNTVRDHIKRGVLTAPIKLSPGPTTPSVWPEDEIDAVIHARIAGKSDDEVRELVSRLDARRRAVA